MSGKKSIKYSEIKAKLGIVSNNKMGDDVAYFTHYLQNTDTKDSIYYIEQAERFIAEQCDKLGLDKERVAKEFTNVDWSEVPFPPVKNPKFTFIDLFAGIGGMRIAFQNLGGKCVYSNEWQPYAKITYEANFGEVPFGDITKVDANTIPNHQVLLAGFPCQPFSIAGVSKKNALGREHGFKDLTQGTLFFDIVRILEAKNTPVFLLENVKNLISHDKGNTFKIIKGTLEDLGYTIYPKVLDGKYFVPQHRERILIAGFRDKTFNHNEKFDFPEMPKPTAIVRDIILNEVDKKYTLTDKLWNYLQNYAIKHKEKGNGFGFGLVDFDGITRTISARYYKDGSEALIPQKGKNPRRLTPRECANLQGFPPEFIIPVSDNQGYRQFGNSVVRPLIQAVGEKLVKSLLSANEPPKSKKSVR
ncbi:MAG: DNA (cytosine-5-)-methyltransferase [Bacteroidetes bacterium]|nr:DNA (cytosine-5-)-methyltransferase [Bacteroidota bacterium]